MRKFLLIALVCVALVALASAWGRSLQDDAVLLSDVQTLTFRKGEWSAARRGKSVPQLKCVGGEACRKYEPEAVQCRNMGSDGESIQWRCEADLSTDYRFGSTDVSCEGFRDRDDPYVLKGSCGLEYTLEYTDQGKERQRQQRHPPRTTTTTTEYVGAKPRSTYVPELPNKEGLLARIRHKLGQVLIVSVVVLAVSTILCGGLVRRLWALFFGVRTHAPTPSQQHWLWGRMPFISSAARPHVRPAAPSAGFYPPPPSAPPMHTFDDDKTPTQSSGPGFWTGAAVGGAAGYMASRLAAGRQQQPQQTSAPVYSTTAAPTETVRVVERTGEAPVAPATTRTAVGFGKTKKR